MAPPVLPILERGGSPNSYAARIPGAGDEDILGRIEAYQKTRQAKVKASVKTIEDRGFRALL